MSCASVQGDYCTRSSLPSLPSPPVPLRSLLTDLDQAQISVLEIATLFLLGFHFPPLAFRVRRSSGIVLSRLCGIAVCIICARLARIHLSCHFPTLPTMVLFSQYTQHQHLILSVIYCDHLEQHTTSQAYFRSIDITWIISLPYIRDDF